MMGYGAKFGSFASGLAGGYKLGRQIAADREDDQVKDELRRVQETQPEERVDFKPGKSVDQPGMVYDQDTGTMVPSAINVDQSASDRFEAARAMDRNIMPERTGDEVSKSYGLFGKTSDRPFTKDEIADLKLGARADVYRKFGRDTEADKLEANRAMLKTAGLQQEHAELGIGRMKREDALGKDLSDIEARRGDFDRFEARGREDGYIADVNAQRAKDGMPPLSDDEAAAVKQSLGLWSNPLARYDYGKQRIAAFYKAGDAKGAEAETRRFESRAAMDFLGALESGNEKLATALYNAYPNGHDVQSIEMGEDGKVSITDGGGTRSIPFGEVAKYAFARIDPEALAKEQVGSYLKLKNALEEEKLLPSKKAETELKQAQGGLFKEKAETERTVRRELIKAQAEKAGGGGRPQLTTAENNGIWSEAKTAMTVDGVTDTERLTPVAALAQRLYADGKASGQNVSFGQSVHQAMEASKDAEFSERKAVDRAKVEAQSMKDKYGRRAFEEYGGQEKFERALAQQYLDNGAALMGNGRRQQQPGTTATAPKAQLDKLQSLLESPDTPEEKRRAYVTAFKRQFPGSAADADKLMAPAAPRTGDGGRKDQNDYSNVNIVIGDMEVYNAPREALRALKVKLSGTRGIGSGDEKAVTILNEFSEKYPNAGIREYKRPESGLINALTR